MTACVFIMRYILHMCGICFAAKQLDWPLCSYENILQCCSFFSETMSRIKFRS